MKHAFSRLMLLVIALALPACDLGGPPEPPTLPTPTVAPTPTPTPAEISAQIGQATRAAGSFHFDIALSGKPVAIDDSNIFTLTSIDGDLKRPDGVLATVKAASGGGTNEIKSVSLGGRQYITNPITRAWQCLPPDSTFDPAVLFDPAKGFEFLFQKGFENITLAGTENVDGRSNYHLTGTIKGELLAPISGGRIGAGPVKLDLWADTATKRASWLVLVDTASDPTTPTTWDIRFSEYDKAVDVQVPPGTSCS